MTTVLVTGAAGHLGSHLVPELEALGLATIGLDLLAPPAPPPAHGRFVQGDLNDVDLLTELARAADLMVHCASIHPWKPYPDEIYLQANIQGAWSVYRALKAAGRDRLVLTSSIAATGYDIPAADWPVTEDRQYTPGDLYSLTKHAQEDIARLHALNGSVRTAALRPPAFMPKGEWETGFALTGCYAVVEDIAAAHVAAVRAVLEGVTLEAFEPFYVTNALPYTAEDGAAAGHHPAAMVERYWPDAYAAMVAHGYQAPWLPAVYSGAKAARLLGWAPQHSFAEWWAGSNVAAGSAQAEV